MLDKVNLENLHGPLYAFFRHQKASGNTWSPNVIYFCEFKLDFSSHSPSTNRFFFLSIIDLTFENKPIAATLVADKLTEVKFKSIKSIRKQKQHRKCALKIGKSEANANGRTNASTSPAILGSSPLPIRNVWSENRAKFSDVVARTDNTYLPVNALKTTHSAQAAKPTLCVEPIVQSNAELGPIGTRKFDFRAELNGPNMPAMVNQCAHPLLAARDDVQNRSFYSECHKLAVESTNAFLDMGSVESWQGSNAFNDSDLLNNRQPMAQNNTAVAGMSTNSV